MMIEPLKFLFLKKFQTPKNLKLSWELFQRKKFQPCYSYTFFEPSENFTYKNFIRAVINILTPKNWTINFRHPFIQRIQKFRPIKFLLIKYLFFDNVQAVTVRASTPKFATEIMTTFSTKGSRPIIKSSTCATYGAFTESSFRTKMFSEFWSSCTFSSI